MRENVKITILKNLLEEVTRKYDYFLLQREKLLEKTYKLSITDELTGLYNRYYVLDRLENEIERAQREKTSFSVIMLDLDNFKRINDKYGHLKGDEVLKKVADILKKHFRSYDVVARFGGDEFLVLILSSESKNKIKKRLIDIRREIEKIFPEGNLSVSFGIVTFPSDFKGLKNKDEIVRVLISTVDSVMYKDKKKRKGML